MTWKEFKEWMEKEGVKDDMPIGYIDIDSYSEVYIVIKGNEVAVWT